MRFSTTRLTAVLGLAIVAGCDQPGGAAPRRQVDPASLGVNTDISVENPSRPDPPAPATPPPSRPILGAKTQDVKDNSKEANNGSFEKKPVIIAKDPILLVGNAYVSIVSKASILKIEQALELYRAQNDGEYPKTHQEFMDKVIKENNIALPTLPSYQEYAYVVDQHRLAIREYPDRKAAMNYPK